MGLAAVLMFSCPDGPLSRTSAFPPIATELRTSLEVRKVPKPEVVNSFDDFICGREQRGRDREAKRFCGPEIDYHLEFGGLHDR
jgi:hypothetical protein